MLMLPILVSRDFSHYSLLCRLLLCFYAPCWQKSLSLSALLCWMCQKKSEWEVEVRIWNKPVEAQLPRKETFQVVLAALWSNRWSASESGWESQSLTRERQSEAGFPDSNFSIFLEFSKTSTSFNWNYPKTKTFWDSPEWVFFLLFFLIWLCNSPAQPLRCPCGLGLLNL